VTPAEAIAAAELIEAETAYRLQLAREMYQAGRRDAEADMAVRWNEIARAATHGPSQADLEAERWGAAGREHFGDPRPGDYPGRVPAPRQPEPEMEIA
jgi:hypothetical protein